MKAEVPKAHGSPNVALTAGLCLQLAVHPG